MCPPYVTPVFLTEGLGQAICSLVSSEGFNCYASCSGETEDPKWFAKGCGTGPADEECDKPILKDRDPSLGEKVAASILKSIEEWKVGGKVVKHPEAVVVKKEELVPSILEAPLVKEASGIEPTSAACTDASSCYKGVSMPFDSKQYYDLRGLKCETLGGKDTCFLEDEQGRELCPPSVTLEYLTNPGDQYTCSPEMSKEYYCSVGCQEGNPEVRWGAHEVKWCAIPGNEAGCPERVAPVLRSQYKMKPWSEVKDPQTPCQAAWESGERPKTPIAKLSVGLLTHEPVSFRSSMETYETFGLFDVLSEFTIYINKRRPEVEIVAQEFAKRHSCIRIMGTEENVGILNGMNYLVGNASQPYFMFLERDFQLVEPSTCVVEQLEAGVKMLEENRAHVMRYRHKKKAGRPNWAAKMFKGQEDKVFQRGQPNLFCNHHYWYEKPEERWPDKIWICNEDVRETGRVFSRLPFCLAFYHIMNPTNPTRHTPLSLFTHTPSYHATNIAVTFFSA